VSDADRNRATIDRFWGLLYAKDWDGLAALFAPDGEYTDVPTPADDVARGPEAIVARLRLGLDPVEEMVHHPRSVVADGDLVMTEHAEEWRWHTGEVVVLPFVSVHQFDADGRILRWWDYWDLTTLLGNAPQWWLDHIMSGGQAQED
jgi:ketosteroid isomerase-like protein